MKTLLLRPRQKGFFMSTTSPLWAPETVLLSSQDCPEGFVLKAHPVNSTDRLSRRRTRFWSGTANVAVAFGQRSSEG
jgi:hypothetical protein